MASRLSCSPAAMAFSIALLLLLLLVAVPSTTAEVLEGRGREVHVEPADEAGCKTYIIMLKPRHDIMEDGADARQEWHQSFLPSTTTSLGQPRLLCSYRAVFDGFSARLTEEELEEVAAKPGFVRSFPNIIYYLQDN